MHIIDYRYIEGEVDRGNYIAIPELDRNKPAVGQFIKLANLNIVLDKPTAFIYVDGFSISQAESGVGPTSTGYVPAIKSGSSYAMHEWVYTFKGKEHLRAANVVSSTCASGIQAMYEAERMINSKVVEEVIIIGAERTTEDTLRLFRELRIPVTCGDGFVYMRMGKDVPGSMHREIKDVKWKYKYHLNPFAFSRTTLDRLSPDYQVDFVKLHGTGTASNTEAEFGLSQLGTPILLKPDIGHTQGISSLIETCMVIDDIYVEGKVLCTANGFGGYYGAFTLET